MFKKTIITKQNTMKTLEELDRALEPIMQDLEDFAENLNLNLPDFQVEFTLNEIDIIDDIGNAGNAGNTGNTGSILKGGKDIPGIYLFEIKKDKTQLFDDWYVDFEKNWNDTIVKYTPNIVNKRVAKHIGERLEWVPLYIGKSKNVFTRIRQHISGSGPTYSLKLNKHPFLYNSTLRVSVWYLGELKHYEIIATVIESTLRDKINPIVGKQ